MWIMLLSMYCIMTKYSNMQLQFILDTHVCVIMHSCCLFSKSNNNQLAHCTDKSESQCYLFYERLKETNISCLLVVNSDPVNKRMRLSGYRSFTDKLRAV